MKHKRAPRLPIAKPKPPPPKDAPPDKICATCRFFVPADDPMAKGECRRFPPVVMFRDFPVTSIFPPTPPGAWCGEYQTGAAAIR